MFKRGIKITLLSALVVLFIASMAGQASAATNTFNFDYTFSGMSPGTTTPYLTALFDDSYGDDNTVRVFIDVLNLDSTSSVTKLYFNFDSLLTVDYFTPVYTGDSIPNSVTAGQDAYKADGDGLYDIFFDMPPPTGQLSERLTDNETLSYDITFTSAADVSAFNYISTPDGGAGEYLAAAHIQGINGMGASGSGWVGVVVPEPVSSTLFIVGAATMGFRRFRKNKKIS